MRLVGAAAVFSPGLLTGGESVSARAFITEARPRPVAGAWAVFFSFVIPKAALGRMREPTSLSGLPLPCPTAAISSVSSGFLEEWASKSTSHVLHRDAILNVYNKCSSPILLFRRVTSVAWLYAWLQCTRSKTHATQYMSRRRFCVAQHILLLLVVLLMVS